MDIDCDGVNRSKGKCANDQSGQGQTRWKTEASAYGIPDLDANLHSYVVFGNEDHNPAFDPRKQGIEPLSVVAVVCGGQVVSFISNFTHFLVQLLTRCQFYGVWGDTNGGTTTGEASIALGDLCFPKENLSGNNGHDPRDVLYLAFPGKAAVPGKNGAKWTAKTAKEFQDSIKSLGDRLVASLKQIFVSKYIAV